MRAGCFTVLWSIYHQRLSPDVSPKYRHPAKEFLLSWEGIHNFRLRCTADPPRDKTSSDHQTQQE